MDMDSHRYVDHHRYIVCIESRARKSKNWEEADFYDSDDDTFLDRTGDVERKRQKRISRVKPVERKTENFESLVSSLFILRVLLSPFLPARYLLHRQQSAIFASRHHEAYKLNTHLLRMTLS